MAVNERQVERRGGRCCCRRWRWREMNEEGERGVLKE
jgi:hypothetical protein